MAYVPLDTNDLQAGKPVKEELLQQIRENFEALKAGLDAVEDTVLFDIFNTTVVNPDIVANINRKMPVYRAKSALEIVGFALAFPQMYPGTSEDTTGTLTIVLEKSTNNGTTWSNILSSDIDATTEGVGDAITSISITPGQEELAVGDMLRFQYSSLRNEEPDHVLLLIGQTVA